MIIRYIYREGRDTRQLLGCVVCTDTGRLGYSLCHPLDRRKLTKRRAREIALSRAEKRTVALMPFSLQVAPDRWVSDSWRSYRRSSAQTRLVPLTVWPYLDALRNGHKVIP